MVQGVSEKLLDTELVKKAPAIFGTWRFIIVFVNASHRNLF